jgi:hypothetical protein
MNTTAITIETPKDYPSLADPFTGKLKFVQNMGTTTFGVSTAYNAVPYNKETTIGLDGIFSVIKTVS